MKKYSLIATLAFVGVAFAGVAFAARAAHADGKPDSAPATQQSGDKQDPKKDEKLGNAEIGKPAPDFALKDINGKDVKLSDFKGKVVVLEWFNPGCPYCQYAYGDGGPLRELPARLTKQGVVWLSVNSGVSADPAATKKFLEEHKLTTPMLMDPDGRVGMAYGAKSTPHCFVIDEKGVLRYRGALDNAPMGKVGDKDTKTNYVEKAIDELRNGKAVTQPDTKSYGCSVKYPKA